MEVRLSSDEHLVSRVRAGSQEAFAILWERYHRPLLSYCRHVLRSHHEAEEAVQQAFTNAYRAMVQGEERELHVRPWLYRIARNQCFTILRTRKPAEQLGDDEPSLVGLSEEVAGRAELRAMLRDLAALPVDQREALVLAELHDNSHVQVAEILGCGHNKVKALIFQARATLIKSRQARALGCEEVQSQLSVLRGGSLRRSVLRRHLAECDACRLFGAEVKRQRAALALVLPVMPSAVLKLGAASAFAATTAASSAGASAGAGTAGAGGVGAGIAAKLGVPAALLKGAATTLAVTTVAAGGVTTTAQVARDVTRDSRAPIAQSAPASLQPGQAELVAGSPVAPPDSAVPGAPAPQAALPAAGRPGAVLPGIPSAPGAGKLRPGLAPPAQGLPDKQRPDAPKQQPARPRPPLQTPRPARPVPTRKPGDGPARERPRPRPRPGAKREPLRPEPAAPPAGQDPAGVP